MSGPAQKPTSQQRIAAIAFVLSLGVVGVAERDLWSRPQAEVRGPKLLWRIVSSNALFALVYLRWGRRRAA